MGERKALPGFENLEGLVKVQLVEKQDNRNQIKLCAVAPLREVFTGLNIQLGKAI